MNVDDAGEVAVEVVQSAEEDLDVALDYKRQNLMIKGVGVGAGTGLLVGIGGGLLVGGPIGMLVGGMIFGALAGTTSGALTGAGVAHAAKHKFAGSKRRLEAKERLEDRVSEFSAKIVMRTTTIVKQYEVISNSLIFFVIDSKHLIKILAAN